jgi:hypothetical protein
MLPDVSVVETKTGLGNGFWVAVEARYKPRAFMPGFMTNVMVKLEPDAPVRLSAAPLSSVRLTL